MIAAPSSFRGYAGEVIREIIRLRCLMSILLVLMFSIITGLVLSFSGIFGSILAAWCGAWLLGVFAVPASQGDFSRGITSQKIERGDAWFYAIRLLAIYTVWGIPLGIIVYKASNQIVSAGSDGLPSFNFGFGATWSIVLLIILCTLPLFSAIIAAATDSLVDALSLQAWKWLFFVRGADIPSFLVSFYGGLLLFWMYYAIPVTILAAFFVKTSPRMAMFVAMWIPLFPSLVAPCLLGKLAGVFVFGEDSIEGEFDDDEIPVISKAATVLTSPADLSITKPVVTQAGVVAQDGSTITTLKSDPPSALVKLIREKLGQVSDVAAAYLVEVSTGEEGKSEITLVVVFKPDSKLSSRQGVTKPLLGQIKVLFPSTEQQTQAEALGLKIYTAS